MISRRNSILMTCHYPDLGRASNWSCHEVNMLQPIRSTSKNWVVTRHQYGIFCSRFPRRQFAGKPAVLSRKVCQHLQTFVWNCVPYTGLKFEKKKIFFFSLFFFAGLHSRIFIGRWSSRWIEKQRKRSIFQPRRYLWLAFEVGNFYIFCRSDHFCEINALVFFDHFFQRFLCWFEVSWRSTRQDRWTFYPIGR